MTDPAKLRAMCIRDIERFVNETLDRSWPRSLSQMSDHDFQLLADAVNWDWSKERDQTLTQPNAGIDEAGVINRPGDPAKQHAIRDIELFVNLTLGRSGDLHSLSQLSEQDLQLLADAVNEDWWKETDQSLTELNAAIDKAVVQQSLATATPAS